MEIETLLAIKSVLSWKGIVVLVLILLPVFLSHFLKAIPRDLMFTIAALISALTGIVPSEQLFHAVANQAIMAVFGLWLVGKAMHQQGLFHHYVSFLLPVKKEWRLSRLIFFCQTLIFGAFLQHRYFPLAMLRPLSRDAEKEGGDLSVYGFPFGYLFLIGGLATAIGNPANILLLTLFSISNGNILTDFFAFAPLALLPILFSVIILHIVKKMFRKPYSQFLNAAACAVVPSDSLLIGKEPIDTVLREGKPITKMTTLQSGDLILFTKTPPRAPFSHYALFNHTHFGATRLWKKIIIVLCFLGAIGSTLVDIPIGSAFFVAGLILLCIHSFPIRKTFQEEFPLPPLLEIFSAYIFFIAMQNSGLSNWLASLISVRSPSLILTLFFFITQLLSHLMPRPVAFSIPFSIALTLFSNHPAQLLLIGINIAFAAALPLFGTPLMDEIAISNAISGRAALSIRILLILVLFASVMIPTCLVWS